MGTLGKQKESSREDLDKLYSIDANAYAEWAFDVQTQSLTYGVDSSKRVENLWCFDVETYPNFWSFAAIAVDSDERVVFEWSERVDERWELRDFLHGKTFIGYNNLSYDNPVVNYAVGGEDKGNNGVYQLSKLIVTDRTWYWDNLVGRSAGKQADARMAKIRKLRKVGALTPFNTIDLAQTLTGNGGRFPSLKQVAIHLRWPKLQSLPYDPEVPLTHAQMGDVLSYNLNDVGITKALYLKVKHKIEMRKNIGEKFGVDLINASESKIANVVIESKIPKPSVTGTRHYGIYGRDIVASNLLFHSETMRDALAAIKDTDLQSSKSLIHLRGLKPNQIQLGGVTYTMGVGGLHSVDAPGVFQSTDDCHIRDADVESYYPFIIINGGYEPEHLKGQFLPVYIDMVNTRVVAKRSGDSTTDGALKIAINGSFGKLNSEHFWLYDPKMFYSVTLNGQLYLLDLIEKFGRAGIEVISANTDGVVCQIHPAQEDAYLNVCGEWKNRTGFNLGFTNYETYVRRDVNNYITKKDNGEVKEKGFFLTKTDYSKGYDKPIIPKAVGRYFLDGIPPEETIMAEKSIYEFCMTKDIGDQFTPIYSYRGEEVEVQRHNRFYVTKHVGGRLLKRREAGSDVAVVAKNLVTMANDVYDDMPHPDYDYYIKEAWKVIHKIQPPPSKQMTLF